MSKLARPSLFVAALLAVGCAEVITYSNKAVEQGEKLQAEGRIEDAAGAYRSATQQNPRNYRAFFHLGECYQQLGREQQAIQSFRTALDVMPRVDLKSIQAEDREEVDLRERIVEGYADCVAKAASRDAELSAMAARAAATNKPLDHYAFARANALAGDADAAIEAYDGAMRASKVGDRAIAKSFGLYLAQVGQKQRAIEVLQKAYAFTPEDREIDLALRRLGVVPGPSLLQPGQLNRPVLPKGPLPELEINIRDQNKPKPATP